jgi:hypothetical protein
MQLELIYTLLYSAYCIHINAVLHVRVSVDNKAITSDTSLQTLIQNRCRSASQDQGH